MTMRRGACPSLSAPMKTGDGLLVRLNPCGGSLSPARLAGIARAAAQHGNGVLEITARGNLQVRGLVDMTVDPFTADVAALGIAADDGVEVRTGPLAGRDAAEIADPRPIAGAIRSGITERGLQGRLAPKVSVLVDGGGALGLGALAADIRMEALAGGRWRVAVGGSAGKAAVLGSGDAAEAGEAALACLAVLAEAGAVARARDLPLNAFGKARAGLGVECARGAGGRQVPVGAFALVGGAVARGFALPFGQTAADELAGFAGGLEAGWQVRLAPGRGLLVVDLSPGEAERVAELAKRHGLVTDPDDPRLRIAACAGAPACASAHLPTKAIAAAVVADGSGLPEGRAMLHVSGCAKKCARPAGPSVALVGTATGFGIEGEGMAVDAATRLRLTRLAGRFVPGGRKSA